MRTDGTDPMADFDAVRLGLAHSAIAVSDAILEAGVHKIDALFGKGFAQANPALVGQYLEATVQTFRNDMAGIAGFGGDMEFGEDMAVEFDFEPEPPARKRRK